MAFQKDRKIVAIRELSATEPEHIENGKVIPAKLVDQGLTREEAIEFCVNQADRADQKFVKSGETRRGPETAASRDAWLDLAYAFQQGLGANTPVSIAQEFDKRYAERFSPDGKSMFNAGEILADILAMPMPEQQAAA